MKTETVVFTIPIVWGKALISNDFTGLAENDLDQLNIWYENNKPGYCMDTNGFVNYKNFQGEGREVADYTFMRALKP